MLTDPIVQQLHRLRLPAMAAALEQLLANAQHSPLTFEERLSLMIQHEISERDSKRLAQRLRWAKLPQPAVLEDLDIRTPRGLDPHRPHGDVRAIRRPIMSQPVVTDDEERSRLEVRVAGELVGWLAYHRAGEIVIVENTEVDRAHEGEGEAREAADERHVPGGLSRGQPCQGVDQPAPRARADPAGAEAT